jgi:predicted nucleotidyltransferase
MAESPHESDLEKIAKLLRDQGVEFIVIGGQAASAHGSPLVTYDVDLCYRRTPQNLERLAKALRQLNPTLRNAPADLPFIIDARTLTLGSNFTFATINGNLDLLGWVEPIGDYEAVSRNAITVSVAGMELKIIGLDDLIRIKQHIRRQKDQMALIQLLAIKKIRDEQ